MSRYPRDWYVSAQNQTLASSVGGKQKSFPNSMLIALRNIYCTYEPVTWLLLVHVDTTEHTWTHMSYTKMYAE